MVRVIFALDVLMVRHSPEGAETRNLFTFRLDISGGLFSPSND